MYSSSFSKLFVSSPTSQIILQPFPRFTYVTAHSPTLLSFLLRHRIFTYVTRQVAHVLMAHSRAKLKSKGDSACSFLWKVNCTTDVVNKTL